jgi:hypothetical protein
MFEFNETAQFIFGQQHNGKKATRVFAARHGKAMPKRKISNSFRRGSR